MEDASSRGGRRPPPPPPPRSGRERRREPRYELLAQIEIDQSGEVCLLPAANISAGGIFVQMTVDDAPAITLGAPVHVHLDLGSDADGEPLVLSTDAEVVRLVLPQGERAGGIGLMWTSDDPAVARQLARILEHVRRGGGVGAE